MQVEVEQKRGLQAEDLAGMQNLGEVQLAPGGSQLYYDLYYINREKNVYQGEIWQLDLRDRDNPRRLTAGPGRDSSPRLSPDGRQLAFLSNRGEDKKRQAYLLDLRQPGEARQLTRFQGDVSNLTWAPDSRHLVLTVETPDDPARATVWNRPESAQARREREAREQEAARVGGQPVVFNRIKLRADGRRTLLPADAHAQLWLLDTADPDRLPRQVTSGPFNAFQPAVAPDGRRLAFSSTRDPQQYDFTCISDLWLVDLAGSEAAPARITRSQGPATGPVWSPDGERLAYVGHTNPKDGSFLEPAHVWVVEARPDSPSTCLTSGLDRPVANLLNTDARVFGETPLGWSDDGRTIYFAATGEASVRLFSVAADAKAAPVALTPADRHIYSYSFAVKENLVAFASASPLNPGDIFIQPLEKGQQPQPVTACNASWLKDFVLVEPETIRVPSRDGSVELEGWLLKPPGFDPARKYPLLLQIHGGPHTAYGHSFYFEFQALAAQGYVVLYTNPRGSVGYGYDFARAIHNDWGNLDYEDIMAAVDRVIGQGYIDESRLGVTGGSYGGYMTNWIVTHTDRFKVALTQRCVSNLVTMYTLSDIGFLFIETEFEGDIWSNPLIWERSPIAHANRARTPLLMLHSEADFRCPIEQAEEFYMALKRAGCEVELVRTPNEDHNLSRSGSPDHRIGRLRRIMEWFEKRL